ncbi:MAG: hypothetical protein JKY70_04725 [Mucilaginibacter sp.]|nr:hypothetical protein [Mucilaginibacter sp.]
MIKKLSILVGYFVFLQSSNALAQQQNAALIELRNLIAPVKPTEFYFKEVVDGRKTKTGLGKLQPYKGSSFTTPYIVDFKGGRVELINFIKRSAEVNNKLRPIILTIKELSVNEEPVINGLVKGSVKINLLFALEGSYVPIDLTSYSTTTSYQRTAGPAQYIEPILSKAIINGILFFDNWINQNADTNIKLAKGVKLSFSDYDEKPDGDTVYYKVSRPITWDDFKGKPPKNTRRGAEIFSYIGYNQEVELRNGVIYVKVAVKSWVAKSACWVLPGMQSDYALNHEQRHFDITRLVAERFKASLKVKTTAPDTFEGEMNAAYLDALRELTALQRQYDNETSHGGNSNAQEQWNIRIDKELSASGIK